MRRSEYQRALHAVREARPFVPIMPMFSSGIIIAANNAVDSGMSIEVPDGTTMVAAASYENAFVQVGKDTPDAVPALGAVASGLVMPTRFLAGGGMQGAMQYMRSFVGPFFWYAGKTLEIASTNGGTQHINVIFWSE